jgi:hypothetical protein
MKVLTIGQAAKSVGLTRIIHRAFEFKLATVA